MSSNEDDVINFAEEFLYTRIMEQITNVHGDFTGSVIGCTDHILEYFEARFRQGEEVIRNFEAYCMENELENMYDGIAKYLIELYNMIGIKLDTDREMLSFSDMYDIYIVFVISLRSTIVSSYKTYLLENGITTYTDKHLHVYLFSDENCFNDAFIQNAAKSNPELALVNITNLIDDNILTIDQTDFGEWLYKFVVDNRLIHEGVGDEF
jgi:hypothetical protein